MTNMHDANLQIIPNNILENNVSDIERLVGITEFASRAPTLTNHMIHHDTTCLFRRLPAGAWGGGLEILDDPRPQSAAYGCIRLLMAAAHAHAGAAALCSWRAHRGRGQDAKEPQGTLISNRIQAALAWHFVRHICACSPILAR